MNRWTDRWTDRWTSRQTDRLIIDMDGVNRFLDLENIVLDAKIIILCALVQKLWPKTSFCTMEGNAPIFGQHITDCKEVGDWSNLSYHM